MSAIGPRPEHSVSGAGSDRGTSATFEGGRGRGHHRRIEPAPIPLPTILSFDCYGTLIDWETGIVAALHPLLARHHVTASPDTMLSAYARAEAAAEAGPHRPYRDVLRHTFHAMAADLGFAPRPEETDTLLEALPQWPVFPDTVEALRRLARHCKLAIISNVDDDLIAQTCAGFEGVPFHAIVTAEQASCYKPSFAIFDRARSEFGALAGGWVHAAQSLHHDVGPARELGIPVVHVVRDSGRGATAVPDSGAVPDWSVPDLRALADAVERAAG